MTITVTPTATAHDYDWLKTQIAGWLHRSNLTASIPTFIALADRAVIS